jgi:hypothetical protein
MSKRNVNKFRIDRAHKIDLLAEILTKEGILKDIGPLTRASNLCRNSTQDNKWEYNVRELDFGEIESDLKIRPKAIENLKLYLSINLEGICYADEEYFDPFTELICDIVIKGSHSKDREVICCWYLDRYISEFKLTEQGLKNLKKEGLPNNILKDLELLKNRKFPTESEFKEAVEKQIGIEQTIRYKDRILKRAKDNEPSEIHPRYHFQFGGEEILDRIDNLNIDFGSSLFMEPPRFPHPPLDIILGIDFVLSNFYGRKWKELNQDTTYRNIVKEAQDRFWKPYAMAIASKWSNTINSDWQSRDIWPQLIS